MSPRTEKRHYSLKKVELPTRGVFYEIPVSDKEPLDHLPSKYVEERMAYFFGRVRERIKVTCAKHNQDKRPNEEKDLNELEEELREALDRLQRASFRDQQELAIFCQRLDEAWIQYKSRQPKLTAIATLAEQMLKLERNAVEELFDLPEKMGFQPGRHPITAEIEIDLPEPVSEEEDEEPETPDQMERVQKDPERYEALEALQEHLIAQLRVTNDSFKAIEKLPEELNVHFEKIRLMKAQVAQAIDQAKRELEPMQAAVNTGEDKEKLDAMPKMIREAYIQSYKNYLSLFSHIAHFMEACAGVLRTIAQVEPKKEEYENRFVSTEKDLLGQYPNQEIIFGEEYERFQSLQKEFDSLMERLNQAKGTIHSLQRDAVALVKDESVDELVRNLLELVANGNRELILSLFDNIDELTAEKPPVIHDWKLVDEIPGRIYWAQMSEQERRNMAITLFFNEYPLVQHLAEDERWDELRWLLSRMGDRHLKAAKMSAACFGSKRAVYPTHQDLKKACFPRAYQDDESEGLPFEKPSEERPRFSWRTASEEGQKKEIRNRLMEMPLIKELAEKIEQEKNETEKEKAIRMFSHLLESLHKNELRITPFALSTPLKGREPEDIFQAAFPELYEVEE